MVCCFLQCLHTVKHCACAEWKLIFKRKTIELWHVIFSVLPDMREKKADGEEEEITLQQIHITVEKVKKIKEHYRKEREKAKRKEKSKEDKTQKPTSKNDKKYWRYLLTVGYLISLLWKAQHPHLDCRLLCSSRWRICSAHSYGQDLQLLIDYM